MNKTASWGSAPNPYFAREHTLLLDGKWDFAVTKDESFPSAYRSILVPFAPETAKSGVQQAVLPDNVMHYRLIICDTPEEYKGKRALIHFTAVDQIADVYWNGEHLAHHEGGYWPFSILVPHLEDGDEIRLIVRDDTSSDVYGRGKQSLKPGGIWYTATSGIWGTVYAEYLDEGFYFQKVQITPNFDRKSVEFHLGKDGADASISVIAPNDSKLEIIADQEGNGIADLSNAFFPWSNEAPNLYRVVIQKESDSVRSVFGLRKIEKIEKGGKQYIALNGKPILLNSLLDQGYYSPETGLTPKSDDQIKEELELVKKLGFNALRKHIKIEPTRWYYECDRLGILVIQDMVNSGGPVPLLRLALAPFIPFRFNDKNYKKMKRGNPLSRRMFEQELEETVSLLRPVASILVWTLFNEGWGQFDAARLTERLRQLDPTRLIDSTSGWFDQGVGDFDSHHVYFRRPKLKNGGLRVLGLSEYGGYSLGIDGHITKKKTFGYAKIKSQEDLYEAYAKSYRQDLIPLIANQGLSDIVLTQWSDVEGEINGLLTYDREVMKVDAMKMSSLNDELYQAFENTIGGKK